MRRPRVAAALSLAVVLTGAAVGACGGSSHPATSAATFAQSSAVQTASAYASTSAVKPAHSSSSPGASSGGGSEAPVSAGGSHASPGGGESANSSHNSAHHPVSGKYPPAFVAAVKAFAGCVRGHGVSIPEPNFSGHGEIFSRAHVNPNNPAYRTALQACESDLIAILRAAGASHIQGIG